MTSVTKRVVSFLVAVAAGVLIGSVATFFIAYHVGYTKAFFERMESFTQGSALTAYVQTNECAQLRLGDVSDALSRAEKRLNETLFTVARYSSKLDVDLSKQKKFLRNVSTYFSIYPESVSSKEVKIFLESYPPYGKEEINETTCSSGICRLAKQHIKPFDFTPSR